MTITVWLLTLELPIITTGTITAAYYAIDHTGRANTRAQELADIETWLQQIRSTSR